MKHDGFSCNVLQGGYLLWGCRSVAHGVLRRLRLWSLGSHGSPIGLGCFAELVKESVDLVDCVRFQFQSFCQGIAILVAFEIG